MAKRFRILTIDDEEAVRRSIKYYLEDSDFEVLEACNGREGLEVFRRDTPDLILCDLRMPEVDGLQVLATVTAEAPDTPIIIVSGTGVLGDAIEAVRLGAWNYVLKPIQDMGALEFAINSALERAKLRLDNHAYQAHLELEVERRTQALRESETRFRTVVESLNEGIVITDESDVVTYINSRMAEMCGYATAELVGRPTGVMGPDHVRDALRVKTNDRLRGIAEVYETQLIRKSGEVFWVEISAGPYPSPDGTIIGSLSIVRDITGRKRAEQDHEKLEAQLRRSQKMETIGTLAGGVAHDFNNILTPIMGYSEMAMIHLEKQSPARADLEEIIVAAHRAKDLVRQILTFSRQGEEERKPVLLQLIVKEALNLLRASIPVTVAIRESIKQDIGAIHCDPTQIHQVLMNLCINAAHAMKGRTGILEVKLDTFYVDAEFSCLHVNLSEGQYVRMTISDNGHGMDRATTERIFEPFFTTKSVDEGTGLGLSVVHGIVTAHGGGISVYSEPEQGTTFQVYLPYATSNERGDLDDELPVPTGSERILFVDDELPNTLMAKQMLASLGYDVVIRTSSVEALEMFLKNPNRYDLVITDQTMPQITGNELAQEILKVRPDMPIILVTGFSETVTATNYREMGFCAYIMKPLIYRDLALTVRNALKEVTNEIH